MDLKQKQLTSLPELDAFALLLKENGFEVILSDKPRSYFHFAKNGNIGYVQKSYFSGYDFSINYKPTAKFGTGYNYKQMVDLSLETAEKTLNRKKYPIEGKVQFYESANEYIKQEITAFFNYYIL